MIDAVRVTHVYPDGRSEEISDPSIKVMEVLDICSDFLKHMDATSFCATIGFIVDEWAIEHHVSSDMAEHMLDEIKEVAKNVHKDLRLPGD